MATATHTIPPSIDDVRTYCESRHNGIDPELFVAYYDQRDWKLSRGQPMTDWKASVRYWERNGTGKHDNHPDQRKEYSELSDELFGPT